MKRHRWSHIPDAHAKARIAIPGAIPRAHLLAQTVRRIAEGLVADREGVTRKEASYGFRLLRWNEPLKQWIAFARGLDGGFAKRGELVIFAGGPLLRVGDRLPLPVRTDQFIALQPAHRRIDRSAR